MTIQYITRLLDFTLPDQKRLSREELRFDIILMITFFFIKDQSTTVLHKHSLTSRSLSQIGSMSSEHKAMIYQTPTSCRVPSLSSCYNFKVIASHFLKVGSSDIKDLPLLDHLLLCLPAFLEGPWQTGTAPAQNYICKGQEEHTVEIKHRYCI